MRLATITVNAKPAAAALLDDGSYLDIAKAANDLTGASGLALRSGDLQTIIESGSDTVDAIRVLVSEAEAGKHSAARQGADAQLLAPLPKPRKNVFCVGRNYAEHIAEGERAQNTKVGVSENPVYFTKPPTAVIGPNCTIPIFPTVSESIDYEVELAVIIGKPGRNISQSKAYDHIFGLTILNDISARDVQRAHGGQYFKGKALDGSCPIGPWIVTLDAISDPQKLDIGLTINGEVRQNSNTASMIFDIPTIIESLSAGLTLEPGDIIATGTPSGVGYAMEPPCFLKDGDIVVCEISEIGTLQNTMKTEVNT